jgi:DNA-binding transcriptional MerR regulator
MKTSQILEKVDIPRHKLYYLEQKGYIKPKRFAAGDLETREYTKKDLKMIELIWKHLKKGFKHKKAFEMAKEEFKRATNKSKKQISSRG